MVDRKPASAPEARLWGITSDRWASLLQTLGFPAALVAFLCVVFYQNVPTVVNAHVRLLERTGDTLEAMDKTLQQSNQLLSEVADVERQTKTFIQNAETAHRNQLEKLDTIINASKGSGK